MTPVGCVGEETVAAFVEGRLADDALAAAELHAATCAACQDLLVVAMRSLTRARSVAPPAASPSSLPRGTTLGRYTVLELTGRGGMGEVYTAYDAELDRKIALKLLHARAGANAQANARLQREARAMAKVSHPNVVAVHDTGTVEGRVFIAMEFVEGVTLQEWLAARPRSRQEIVATFLMAARGLAAAHAAGLVHRDFKPHYVMIGVDGTARVLDFGLVTPVGASAQELAIATSEAAEAPADLRLTRTGEVLGTPLYMAPEQIRGEEADARADQFSFCVALYQALFGIDPFGAGSVKTLMNDVLAGRLRPPPLGSAVPRRLRQVVLRGLGHDPLGRWPTMRDLIAALERAMIRGRRRFGLAAGVAVVAALAVLAIVRRAGAPPTLCRGGPLAIAGAWEGPALGHRPRREAVRAAFVGSAAPSVSEVWTRVAEKLDRYVESWLATYRDACEGTQVRHEQSAATLDLRMSCLSERRTALAALTDVLARADTEVVRNAIGAVNALPPLERCSDLPQLHAPVDPPRDASTRARVEDVRRRAAMAKALNDTGKHAESKQLATSLLAEARAVGYRHLVAESLAMLARAYSTFRFDADDVPIREEAVWTAIAVGRFDLASEMAIQTFGRIALTGRQQESAPFWSAAAHALLDRQGKGHDLQQGWLLQNEALLRLREGQPVAALDLARRATVLKAREVREDDPDIAISLNTEANALQALGRNAEALDVSDRVYSIFVRTYGEASLEAGCTLNNRGEYLITLGRPAEALEALRGSVRRLEAQVGATSLLLAIPLTALGRALLALGRPTEAIPPLERALRVRVGGEADAALVAETRTALTAARAKVRYKASAPEEKGARQSAGI